MKKQSFVSKRKDITNNKTTKPADDILSFLSPSSGPSPPVRSSPVARQKPQCECESLKQQNSELQKQIEDLQKQNKLLKLKLAKQAAQPEQQEQLIIKSQVQNSLTASQLKLDGSIASLETKNNQSMLTALKSQNQDIEIQKLQIQLLQAEQNQNQLKSVILAQNQQINELLQK